MARIEVRTQAELDKALKRLKDGDYIACVGSGYFTASGSSTVRASGSSTVRAYDSSTVRATGSSTVTAYDSSTVRAYGSSTVTATGSSTVRAYDSSTVTASPYVAIHRFGTSAKVRGGVLMQVPRITDPAIWCEFYGLIPKRGLVTLFKAVTEDYHSSYGFDYTPGTKPEAPDFDPAPRDCGKGLHGCVAPVIALSYMPDAKRFVAIPVRVSDMGMPDPDGDTRKIRFRRAAKPVYEVDIDGNPVA